MPKRIRSPEYLELQRKYKAEMYKTRKLEAIIYLGGECVKCGGKVELELDHIDRKSKKFPISRAPSNKLFWEEVQKCQVLCRWCHRIKSTEEHQGDNYPHSKLSSDQVKEIRIKLDQGHIGSELSKEYNICPMQISRIKNRKRWNHLE